METPNNIIEQAVLDCFEITRQELYSKKEIYPVNGARSVFMYLLLKNGAKRAEIQRIFGYSAVRTIDFRIKKVRDGVKGGRGRYNSDVEKVNKKIDELKTNKNDRKIVS